MEIRRRGRHRDSSGEIRFTLALCPGVSRELCFVLAWRCARDKEGRKDPRTAGHFLIEVI